MGLPAPLDPERAADFSERDGVLDHWGESVYAERFFAALEAEAFSVDEQTCDLYALIDAGLAAVPDECRFRELVEDTVALCRRYDDVKLILRKILFRYGHPDCTNMFQEHRHHADGSAQGRAGSHQDRHGRAQLRL